MPINILSGLPPVSYSWLHYHIWCLGCHFMVKSSLLYQPRDELHVSLRYILSTRKKWCKTKGIEIYLIKCTVYFNKDCSLYSSVSASYFISALFYIVFIKVHISITVWCRSVNIAGYSIKNLPNALHYIEW